MRNVESAIRMPVRDRVVQFASFLYACCKVDSSEEFRALSAEEISGEKRDGGLVPIGSRSLHQVLKGATHSDVLFPKVGIEWADIPCGIDVQLDGGIRYLEEPWLGVVRTCSQNSRANERQWPIPRSRTPIFPRFVSWTVASAENAVIVGAPNSTA